MPPVAEENCHHGLQNVRPVQAVSTTVGTSVISCLGIARGASGQSLAAALSCNAMKLTLPGPVVPASVPPPARG